MRRRSVLCALPGLAALPPAGQALAGTEAAIHPDRVLVFPRDFGAHPASRTEWWYITGALQVAGAASVDYGFQITFFRSRVDVAASHPSAFAARQLLSAHVAVTDLPAQRLWHDQRVARSGFGVAQASESDTDVKLRDWTVRRRPGGPSPGYEAQTRARDFALNLDLRETQPLLLQGQAGYSRKGPDADQASHYYSKPHLAVTGELQLAGRALRVTGRAWLDHEWSEALLHPDAIGWDWIGMNLDDGGALTAFRLRRRDGSTLWAGGSFRAAGGAVRSFAPSEVQFSPGRRWTSPATRAVYPVQWQVDTPAGRFEVVSRLDAQELDGRSSTGAVYWEGLSELRTPDGRRVGQGYLEMTGYAAALRL